ncbi:hypothetical protein ACOME3_006290 [Neoechinorhynchus agilis]
MAVVSSSRQIFPAGYRNLVRRVRNKRRWANGTNSEMFAMANIFKCYLAYTKENLLRTREEMRRFTTQNGVSIRSLLEAHRLYDDLFRRLSIMRVRPFRSNLLQEMQEAHKTNELKHNIDCLFLKVAIAGSCYPNYFVRTPLDYKTVNKSMKLYDPQRTVKVEKISPIEKNLVADTLQDTLHQDLRMTNATVVLDENDKNLFIVCEGDLNSRTIGDDTTIIIENSVQYLSDNLSHCKVHEDVITLASIDRLTIKPKSARRLIGVNMRSSRNNGYNAHIVKIIRFGRFSAKIEGQDDVHEYQMAAIGTTNDVDCKDFEEFLPSDRRVYLEPVDDEHISSLCSDPARMVEVYVDGDYRRSKLSDALIEVFPGIENRQYHTQRSIQIGPFKSNLKSSFTALPRALNISNEVRIHRSDINGHMLDCESSLDFERLVVAGEVRCNENSVCLFNTTEMPPIVGMPLMMTLIFSPVCQIRADCFRTMYDTCLPIRRLFFSLLQKRDHTSYLSQSVPANSYDWNKPARGDPSGAGYKIDLFGPLDSQVKDSSPLSNPEYVVHMMQQCREMQDRAVSIKASPPMFCEMCWIKLNNKFEIAKHIRSEVHQRNYRMLSEVAYKN